MTGLRRIRRDEAGISVGELVTATMVLGLVLGVALPALVSLQNGHQGVSERTMNLAEGRLLMQQTTRDLRTALRPQSDASPFLLAKGGEVRFYANLDASDRPSLVHFSIDGRARLLERVTPADASSSAPNYTFTGSPRIRMVGEYVVNPTSDPPFRYYDRDANQLPLDPSCSCLSVENRGKVHAVGLRFSVRHTTTLSVAPTTMETRVRLPNVFYNPQGPGPVT